MAFSKNQDEEDKQSKLLFSKDQLNHLEDEIDDAGGFDELMIRKGALKRVGSKRLAVRQFLGSDTESYWNSVFHNTDYYLADHQFVVDKFDVPYVYWSKMKKALDERNARREYAEEKKMESYEELAEANN